MDIAEAVKESLELAAGESAFTAEGVFAAVGLKPTVPEEQRANPEIDVEVGWGRGEHFSAWFEDSVDFLDNLFRLVDAVMEATDTNNVNAAGFKRQGGWGCLDESARQSS